MGDLSNSGKDPVSGAEPILRFWLGTETSSKTPPNWSRWFVPNSEFDQQCRRFLARHEDAAQGRLEAWKRAPRSCLALVLLLDQFPRNMFRDTAQAFATDAQARLLSRDAIATGFDRELSPLLRMFFYLPLEHSENLDDQVESVRLNGALVRENPDYALVLKSAQWHLETIRRFGRFPGRNRALGRPSTQEEIHFSSVAVGNEWVPRKPSAG
jgi:uncharacterized protein (DUF924 family)